MEMTNQEKLDLINSLEIVDVDMDCEGLIYAHVEYSPENLAILGKVVPNVEDYLDDYGDPEHEGEVFDISWAAFEYAKADIFQREEGKFAFLSKEEVMGMYMEEREKRLNLESRYQKLKRQIEAVG